MEPVDPEMSVGDRIKWWRERRGINQAALAGRVGRSRSWLCQIENGTRQLDSFSAILDLARELRVKPWDLTGHRGDLAPDSQYPHPSMPAIRAAMDAVVFDAPDSEPSVDALARRVHDAWHQWFTDPSRFDATGRDLPELLREAQVTVRQLDGAQRREAMRQLSLVYQLLRMFAKRTGSFVDALRAADRAIAIAQDAGDMPLMAAAMWTLAVSHSSMGELEQSLDVSEQAARMLRVGLEDAIPEHMAMWGQTHLIQAVVHGRMKRKDRVWEALSTAGRAAERIGERNDFWTAFGPTNVNIHAVNAAVEMGEPDEALHIARTVDSSVVPSVERRFSHEMQIASIYGQRRDDEACLFSLLNAERVSPQNARYSISMAELTRGMLRRENRLAHRAEARRLGFKIGVLTI
ncbi:MAG TPA: helix-turn-helix transcriptional regulator [Mycobacteriales bacterium]|nr:helix-turn-helix transcriptional regulator [Mycobacteriales bacterium]